MYFVVLLAVVLGVVTFLRQWTGTRPADTETSATTETDHVVFPLRVMADRTEAEPNRPGQFDFWFKNPNTYPIELGLDVKGCKCSKVEMLVLTPDEASRAQAGIPAAATAQISAAAGGFFGLIGPAAVTELRLLDFLAPSGRWQELLDAERNVASVPPQAMGVMRLGFLRKDLGAIRLVAKVWAQEEGKPKTRGGDISLEAPISVDYPVRVRPDNQTLPDLEPNQTVSTDFYCWSSTRAGLDLAAREETKDPCFTCECRRLEGAEFVAAAAELAKEAHTSARAIFRVHVTVRERLSDGTQMDLGPFNRKIVLSCNYADVPPGDCRVLGNVRGDVRVGSEDDKDMVLFRSFPANRGATTRVPVETTQLGTKLVLQSFKPEYLKVEFKEKGLTERGTLYSLTVTVPPNRAAGRFSRDCAIVLKTVGPNPRLVRIPVRGVATMALDSR